MKAAFIFLSIFLALVAVKIGPTLFTEEKTLTNLDKYDYVADNERKVSAANGETFVIPIGQTLDMSYNRSKLATSTYNVPEDLNQNGLNIVFISDNFESKEQFELTAATLQAFLRSIEPWRSYNNFNFFTVYTGNASSTEGSSICNVEVENHRKPTLRCTAKVNDYIIPLALYRFKAVVVSRQEFTSWANLTRLNSSMVALSVPKGTEEQDLTKKIFQHEFAHGFGLRDEMTKSVIALAGSEGTLAAGPNCAPDVKTAVDWWGDMVPRTSDGKYVFSGDENDVGFYYGCAGNEQFLKPTVGSIMNLQDSTKPSNDYGKVSETYLKKVLTYCFSERIYSVKEDEKFFKMYPEYKECVRS